MHFFIDHTQLIPQTELDSFGTDSVSPTNKYNITSKFQLSEQAKVFACQDGMMVVQQSTEDESLVNLILKPKKGLKIPFNAIRYYVYRGVLKESFIIGSVIKPKTEVPDNSFLKRFWENVESFKLSMNLPNHPDPGPKELGYDNSLPGDLNIEEIYDNSQEETFAVYVREGEWIGNFGVTQKIGFEIITETDKINMPESDNGIDLGYLRKSEHIIDLSGLSGLKKRIKQDLILSYIDPAAFFGLHYSLGINISVFDGTTKTLVSKKEGELVALLENFWTKNRVYLDIRNEKGYSYNFDQNYGDSSGENIKLGNSLSSPTSQIYGHNEWPIAVIDTPMSISSDKNNAIINLRIDNNLKPILFIENKDVLDSGSNSHFVDEIKLLNESETDWSKEISLKFPNTSSGAEKKNVAFYIKLNYFRQIININTTRQISNLEPQPAFNAVFASLDTPNLGSDEYTFQQVSNEHLSYIESELPNGEAFSGVAAIGANFDSNRVVFHTKMVFPKQNTGEFYPETKSSIGQGLKLVGSFNQISLLKRDIYCFTQTIQENTNSDPVKVLNIYAYNGYPSSKENLIMLGLTQVELTELKNIIGLSNQYPRYIYFEDMSPYPPIDINGKKFRKYKLNVQGLDENDIATTVAPPSDIFVYTKGGLVFCSKSFVDEETGVGSIFYALSLSTAENNFLDANPTIKSYLENYLINDSTSMGFSFSIWVIRFLLQNSQATIYFTHNLQDLDLIYMDNLNNNDIEEVNLANTSINLIMDVLINLENNTLSDLDISWANLEDLKLKVKNAISKGIYTTAKYVRDYLYIPMYKMGIKYPSTIYWSNKAIDRIRIDVVTPMVDFDEDTMSWGDLFNIWIFELTPGNYPNDTINFTGDSNVVNGNNIYNPTTNAVKNFPKGNWIDPTTNKMTMTLLMNELKNGLQSNLYNTGSIIKGYFNYNTSAFYATVFQQKNLGIQMLGSFPTTATVISKSGNTAVIQFHIYNYLGWESATRFIKGKPGKGNQGVIDDKTVGAGLHIGGTIRNDFIWTETLMF